MANTSQDSTVSSQESSNATDTSNNATENTAAESTAEERDRIKAFLLEPETVKLILLLSGMPKAELSAVLAAVRAETAEEKEEHPSAELFRKLESGREVSLEFSEESNLKDGHYILVSDNVRESAGRGTVWHSVLRHKRTGKVLSLNSKEHRDMILSCSVTRKNAAGSSRPSAKHLPETVETPKGVARVIR